jgi:hypothetical protein
VIVVKKMQVEEIDLAINLFGYYRQAAGITDDRYDRDRVLMTVREYNIRPNLFFRLAWRGQRPVGLVGAFVSQDPVESEQTVTIQFCYLIEEFAELENYELLLDAVSDWAEQLKCSAIRALDIGDHLSKIRWVYEQLDFDPVTVTIMNREL